MKKDDIMEFIIKVLLIGDKNVGVSTIINNFTGKNKQSNPIIKEMDIEGSIVSNVKFQIWRLNTNWYTNGIHFYYQAISSAILVFDVTNKNSFENLDKWVKEIWHKNGRGIIPILIVGNKTNLRENNSNTVTDIEAINYCNLISKQTKEKGFDVEYFPINALNESEITKVFKGFAKIFIDYIEWVYIPGKKFTK